MCRKWRLEKGAGPIPVFALKLFFFFFGLYKKKKKRTGGGRKSCYSHSGSVYTTSTHSDLRFVFVLFPAEKALQEREEILEVKEENRAGAMSLEGDVCVVTGACGFLGKRLVKLLLEEENAAEIRMLDKHVQPQVLQELTGEIDISLILYILFLL